MKRIALFPSAFHPSLGGVEELTGQLALHLAKRGIRPMICVNRWPRNLLSTEIWRDVEICRFPFRMPGNDLKSKMSFQFSHKMILKQVTDCLARFGTEAIHVQCVSSNAWYAACAAEAIGVPLIVSVQGERTMDAAGLYRKSPLYNRLLRGVLRRSQQLTACSQATLDDLEKFNGQPFHSGARVIYNGVGSEAFDPGLQWKHSAEYFFALGRLVPQKGFKSLLKGYKESGLRETHLVIAGEGPEAEALSDIAEELGIADIVHFFGRADRRSVFELMRGSVGVVVPSLCEPMGIVALEAMAVGKPLLVSAIDGLKEVAPSSLWCKHVRPGDVEAIALGLKWLQVIDCSATACYQKRWAEKFLWQNITEQYLEVYSNAAQCSQSPDLTNTPRGNGMW